jgi:hypothetical protein
VVRFRRVAPYLLIAALVILSVGAGVVGNAASQTPEAVLQRAAASTINAASFAFRISSTYDLQREGKSEKMIEIRRKGRYQSPDRWAMTISDSHATSTFTFIGSTEFLPGPNGRMVRLMFPYPITMTEPGIPFLLFPPLNLVLNATDVTRRGDVFTFLVTSVPVPSGWIAYAPLGGQVELPPPRLVRDVRATATITGGYVRSLSLARNVVGLNSEHLQITWWITSVGSASPVGPPT